MTSDLTSPAPSDPAPIDTLGAALPRECARVRALMPAYREIGPAGGFALMLMENALRAADQAMISGDVVAMIRVYEDLKGFTG